MSSKDGVLDDSKHQLCDMGGPSSSEVLRAAPSEFSAVSKVLSSRDHLFAIIKQLSPQDASRVAMVSKMWKDVAERQV